MKQHGRARYHLDKKLGRFPWATELPETDLPNYNPGTEPRPVPAEAAQSVASEAVGA
jgi:hypothetical protein